MTPTQLLIRWFFFFIWLSIVIVPAVLFCRIAISYRRSPWIFFFFGLAMGIFGLNIGRLVLYLLTQITDTEAYTPYLPVIPITVGYGIIFFAISVLKEKLNPKEPNDSLDADL